MEYEFSTEALDLSMHNRDSKMAPNCTSLARVSVASSRSTAAAWRSKSGGETPVIVQMPASIAPSDHQLRQIKQESIEMDDSDEHRCTKRKGYPDDSDSDTDTLPLSTHTDTDQSTENDTGKSPVNSEDSARFRDTVRGVSLSLHDEKLWSAFARCGTEMIINRGGRRMFPHINLTIEGLDPCSLYTVILEIVPADSRRYKYLNNAWVTMGMSDPGHVIQPFVHPDSPNTGAFWSENTVSFSKIRLTNNKDSKSTVEGIALLQSMHKYKAVVKVHNETEPHDSVRVFDFKESAFVAVTAYQNSQITQLKIQNNPFAKAFRDVNNPSFLQAGQASRRKETKQKGTQRKNNQGTKCMSDKKYGNPWHFPYMDHRRDMSHMRSALNECSEDAHQRHKGYNPMTYMMQNLGRSMPMGMPMWQPGSQLMFNAYASHPMFSAVVNQMAILRQNATSGFGHSSSTLSSSTESSSSDRSLHSNIRSGSDEGN